MAKRSRQDKGKGKALEYDEAENEWFREPETT